MFFGIRPYIFRRWSHDSLLFEVTARCNLRCPHCYNVWNNNGGIAENELNTEKALQLIEKAIRESHCRQFTFTGGEPLLRNDLESLVACAHSSCAEVALITNGMLLSEPRIKSLIKSGVSMFELPLNSADGATVNRMAGNVECFEQVTRAATELNEQGAQLAFVFVGTTANIDQWQEVLNLGIALGSRVFLFNRYNAGGECHEHPENLMPSVKQVRQALIIAEQYAKAYGVAISASIPIPPCLVNPKDFPHVGFGFCAAGTRRAYYTLDPVGNVRPCNHTPTILGNIFDTSLKEMVCSEKLRKFVQTRPSFCAGCRMEDACLGGCKAAAEVCYGSLTACDPFLEINRHLAKPIKVHDETA